MHAAALVGAPMFPERVAFGATMDTIEGSTPSAVR